MGEGYVKLHRCLMNWEYKKNPKILAVWVHLLLIANYEPKRWKGIIIERGQCVTSMKSLAEDCGLSVQSVRTALTHLQTNGCLTSKSTNKFTIITLCNYDSYQSGKSVNQQTNQPETNKQFNNNIRIDKKEEIKEDVILSYKSFSAEPEKMRQNFHDSFLENIRRLYPNIATQMVLPSKNEYISLRKKYSDVQLLNLIGYIDNDTHWKGFTHLNAAIKQYLGNSDALPDFKNDVLNEP